MKKKIKDMNKNLEKWITLKECDSKSFKVCFVDLPDLTKLTEDLKIETFTKTRELEKIKKSKIKDLMLKNIYELSEKHDKDILEKFSYSDEMYKNETEETKTRKCMSKINNASLYIATNGRIGEATNMIISKENYDKFNISDYSGKFEILFEDVDDIYLYRKNNSVQPGLVLFYYTDENNIDYYEIESIGFYPERQFIKIKIN
jgi:hypothetical protein